MCREHKSARFDLVFLQYVYDLKSAVSHLSTTFLCGIYWKFFSVYDLKDVCALFPTVQLTRQKRTFNIL